MVQIEDRRSQSMVPIEDRGPNRRFKAKIDGSKRRSEIQIYGSNRKSNVEIEGSTSRSNQIFVHNGVPYSIDLADFLVALALSSIITDWNTRALNFFQQYSCYLNDIHDG